VCIKAENCLATFADVCLDGGGIRGYATLRIINDIMSKVRAQEKEEDAALRNSHSITDYDREQDPLTTKNPLPCHYFDYIVGTSTGGYTSSSVLLMTTLLI
jgi:patatin-like phospholipase/acyl hydrolase